MKVISTSFLALALLHAVAFAGIDADIPQTNQVILSSGAWLPSTKETQKALAAIQAFLEKPASTNEMSNSEIKKILANMKKYRVQFVGVVRDGNKIIWCNFFPAPRKGDGIFFSNWEQQEVRVLDGGFWFWQIDYDPGTGKCAGFVSNGYG